MTQSYNLSQLANNLNTAGQLDATDGLVGAVPPANGGTGLAAYTTGDIIYASGTTSIAKLSDVATGNALLSGGVGVAPGYGKVGLTTHVSGTLPIANGGTNSTATPTAGGVIYGNGTAHAITAAGTSGQVLTSAGAGAPTWSTAASIIAPAAVSVSGTAVDITGIPSTAKRAMVVFTDVTVSAAGFVTLQLGNGSIVTTGYKTTAVNIATAVSPTGSSNVSSIWMYSVATTDPRYGCFTLVKVTGTNTWIITLNANTAATTSVYLSSGYIALGSSLDRVRFGATAGASFTSGTVSIIYES